MKNRWLEGMGNIQLCEGDHISSFPLLTTVFNRLLIINEGRVLTPTRQWRVLYGENGSKEVQLTPPLSGEVVVYYI